MRQKRTAQQSLFDPEPFHHPVADALEAISAWLDAHPELLDTIAADLGAPRPHRSQLRDRAALRGPQALAPGDLSAPLGRQSQRIGHSMI